METIIYHQFRTLHFQLRKNHSGMETIYRFWSLNILLTVLRKNHSGMETNMRRP